jgi:hypothetical protein
MCLKNSFLKNVASLFSRDLRTFFAVGERKHTYLNSPTVTLRPIPTLVWQRGESLNGVVVVVVVKLPINYLVGAM